MKRAAMLVLAGLLLGGCERVVRNMYDQPRLDPGEASPLFADGLATRPPPPGSVAQAEGELAATSSGRRGTQAVLQREAAAEADHPPPLSRELLLRGQQRYTVYCLPCHSAVGDGDGPVVRRGFPHPPSYHQPRLREAGDRHFFEVITQGYGVMTSYADRVAPADRWAIVAYIRALQLSQYAPVAALPASMQARLQVLPRAASASSAGWHEQPATREAGG